jgi:hypothetical protein
MAFNTGNTGLHKILLADARAVSTDSEDDLERQVNGLERLENGFNMGI